MIENRQNVTTVFVSSGCVTLKQLRVRDYSEETL